MFLLVFCNYSYIYITYQNQIINNTEILAELRGSPTPGLRKNAKKKNNTKNRKQTNKQGKKHTTKQYQKLNKTNKEQNPHSKKFIAGSGFEPLISGL